MNSSDYFEEFEEYVGKPVADLILKYVRVYKLKEEHAESFARYLDKQLDEEDQVVKGKFNAARRTNGYTYGTGVMKCILSDWFEKYEKKNREETMRILIAAFESAEIKPLVRELKEEEKRYVQPSGKSSEPESNGKIITGLPSTPLNIPLQKPKTAGPTSSEPYPSNQSGPVCASHAIGKAILKTLDLCKFDGDQELIIKALIKEVQPNQEPRDPDEFHGKEVVVTIADQTKGKTDVKLRLNVQTDWETIPHLTPEYLSENKIQRVIRDDRSYPHALYVDHYDGQNYICINSHGVNNPYPARNGTVYAVDYIQITEI